MVLSAALDSGYIFLSLVAILTSVVGGVYYLNIVKEIFFYKPEYKLNSLLNNKNLLGSIYNNNNTLIKNLQFNHNNIVMSSSISITISIITLITLLFMFMNKEWLSMGKIKFLSFFNNLGPLNINTYSSDFGFKSNYNNISIRNYTTNTRNHTINPWFISGFTDAEGSFMIHLEKIMIK